MSRSSLNMVHVMEPMLGKFLVNPSTSEPVAHCVFDKALVSNDNTYRFCFYAATLTFYNTIPINR